MRELQLAFISNRTTKRLFRLMSTMERDQLFTIGEMAEKLHVTQRTVASDIKYMRGYFGSCIELVSGSRGFIFKEKKPYIYQNRKQDLLGKDCLFEIIQNIFQGKLLRTDELAHLYHFSESTFRRLLVQTSSILASYGLRWRSNPLTIEGSESNLRKFFKDFYYEGIDTSFTLVPDIKLHELVLNQLQDNLGKYNIGSGTTPAAFYYTLYITIKRARLGFSINVPKKLRELAYKGNSFTLLYSLKDGIKDLYHVELSKEEFAWVYLITICKRTFDQEVQEKKFYQHFHKGKDIAYLTEVYLEALELPKVLHLKLTVFLRSFFLSRKINHLFAPVLNKEASDVKEALIRSDSENYQRNLHFLKQHQKNDFLSTPYLEDICVSLTIYCDLIIDFYAPPKRIYFLLEGDHFVCQQVRTRAIQQFGSKHCLTFLPLQQLSKEAINAENVDLVVTNYNRYILDYIVDTDYHLLKSVPDEKNWRFLEKKINPYRKTFF